MLRFSKKKIREIARFVGFFGLQYGIAEVTPNIQLHFFPREIQKENWLRLGRVEKNSPSFSYFSVVLENDSKKSFSNTALRTRIT